MSSGEMPPSVPLPAAETAPPYRRRLSVVQRLYCVLVAPRDAMQDIGFEPDYAGPIVIIGLETVLAVFSLAMVFQKIHVVGPQAVAIMGFVLVVVFLGFVGGVVLTVVRWLVKGWLVKAACGGGSGWDFKTAASVTGYAYFPSVVVGVIGLAISWVLVPSFVVDTSNLETTMAAVSEFQAQVSALALVYSLPMVVAGLLWKSYVGGLGTHFGTREYCSTGTGFAVFFVLGLVGLLISYSSLLF
jgi:hypothetical protein